MGKRVLVIFDGSNISIKALNHALAFSEKGDEIDLAYIVDRNTYENMLKGIKSMGGQEEDLNRAVRDLEHRFRKQISIFIHECRENSINVNTIFRIGDVDGEMLGVLRDKEYNLVVIPYSENYRDKLSRILGRVMSEYRGNILVVK